MAKLNYINLDLNIVDNKLIYEDFLSKNFSNKYDIIIALGYFEYQADYETNFNKIYDSLNSNGNLIFNLPIERNLGNLFGMSRYVNNFKNLFKSVPHPGLKLKKYSDLINLINRFVLKDFKVDYTFLNVVNKKNMIKRLKVRKSLNRYDKFRNDF